MATLFTLVTLLFYGVSKATELVLKENPNFVESHEQDYYGTDFKIDL